MYTELEVESGRFCLIYFMDENWTEEEGKRLKKNSTGTRNGLAEFGRNTGIQEVECWPVMAYRISSRSK